MPFVQKQVTGIIVTYKLLSTYL